MYQINFLKSADCALSENTKKINLCVQFENLLVYKMAPGKR